MNQLLDFLFGNPLLLFLVIGAILNFLQKGKDPEQKREPRKTGTPVSKEKQREEVDWREIFRQEAHTEPKPTKQQEQSYKYEEQPVTEVKRSQELLQKYEEAKRRKESEKSTKKKSLADSPIYKDDLTASNKVRLDFSKVTREDAIKGVVWSEILGKPKSKGSYRPTLNTRRRQG